MVNRGLKHSNSYADRIYSKETFVQSFASVLGKEVRLSDMDIDVLLKYLSRDQSAIAMDGDVSVILIPTTRPDRHANASAIDRQSNSKRPKIPMKLLKKTILSHR